MAALKSDTRVELSFRGRFGFGIDQWAYVPFDVPAGIQRIDVSTSHDHFSLLGIGRNVLDLGIFGPAGHELGNAEGFRGWSGGARAGFMLSAVNATPGYLAGPIEPGRWALALGPVVLNPLGMDWHAKIALTRGVQPSLRPAPVFHPAARRATQPGLVSRRLTHAHSAFRWPAADRRDGVGRHFGRTGFHRLHRPQHQLRQSGLGGNHIRWPGSHRRRRGHHPPRALAGNRIATGRLGRLAVRTARRRLCHLRRDACGPTAAWWWLRIHRCRCRDAHGSSVTTTWTRWRSGTALWNVDDELSLRIWQQLLRQGRRIAAVGGSDSHASTQPVGRPQTVVYAQEPVNARPRGGPPSRSLLCDRVERGDAWRSTHSVATGRRRDRVRR